MHSPHTHPPNTPTYRRVHYIEDWERLGWAWGGREEGAGQGGEVGGDDANVANRRSVPATSPSPVELVALYSACSNDPVRPPWPWCSLHHGRLPFIFCTTWRKKSRGEATGGALHRPASSDQTTIHLSLDLTPGRSSL